MTQQITIEQVNYFGGTGDYNAKALYRKNGKLYLAHIKICFFWKQVHLPRWQPKECKVLKGFQEAINKHQFN